MALRTDIKFVTQDGMLTQAGAQAFTSEINVLAAKIAAAAAVPNASGGATVDTQARAQLAAIKVALTG